MDMNTSDLPADDISSFQGKTVPNIRKRLLRQVILKKSIMSQSLSEVALDSSELLKDDKKSYEKAFSMIWQEDIVVNSFWRGVGFK